MREIREYDEDNEQDVLRLTKDSRLTPEEVEEIIRSAKEAMFPQDVHYLHFQANLSLKEIAEKLQVSVFKVYRCFKENNWTPNGSTVKKEIDEKSIRYLYNERGLSQQEIADELDVSLSTVYRRFKEYDIKARRIESRDEIDSQKIHHLHFEKGLTFSEIGEKMGISIRTITRIFNDHNWEAEGQFVYLSEEEKKKATKERAEKFRLKIQEKRDSLFGTVCRCCGVDKTESNISLPIHRKDGTEHEKDSLWKLEYLNSVNPDDWAALCIPCHRGITWLQKELGFKWEFVETVLSEKREQARSDPYTIPKDAKVSKIYKEIKEGFEGKLSDLVRLIIGDTCYFCGVHYREKILVTHRKDGRSHEKNLFRSEKNIQFLNPNEWVSLCRKHHRYVHWAMDTLGLRWSDLVNHE